MSAFCFINHMTKFQPSLYITNDIWALASDHDTEPFLVHDMKVEVCPFKVWIRGEKTMWFRADQCIIDSSKEEIDEWANQAKRQEVLKSLSWSVIA